MYYVNRRLISVIRLSFPVGLALAAGFILEPLRPVAQYSLFFLIMGLMGNFYFPEIITIDNQHLGLKTVLAKDFKKFELTDVQLFLSKKADYLVLKLDHKYMLELANMNTDLYYQLKPYIRANPY